LHAQGLQVGSQGVHIAGGHGVDNYLPLADAQQWVAGRKPALSFGLCYFNAAGFCAPSPHVRGNKKYSSIHAKVRMIPTALHYATLQPNACMSGTIITNALAYPCLRPVSIALSVTFVALVEG
jgi:hypothetical protein